MRNTYLDSLVKRRQEIREEYEEVCSGLVVESKKHMAICGGKTKNPISPNTRTRKCYLCGMALTEEHTKLLDKEIALTTESWQIIKRQNPAITS